MQLKKQYRANIVYFDIQHNTLEIKDEDVLQSIITSLEGFKFINRNQPFNDLIKIQQKYPKHILVEFDAKPFDELRFMVKAIYNFLSETKQLKQFMLNSVEMMVDGSEVIVYGTETFREKLVNPTFSPTIRGSWNNPILIEKILKKY